MKVQAYSWLADIKIGGTLMSKAILDGVVDVRVVTNVVGADRCEIVIRDPDFVVLDSATFDIGKDLEVGFKEGAKPAVVAFKGEITALSVDQRGDDRHFLVIEGYDKSHRLSHVSRVETYVKMTYTDIANTIAGRNGLRAVVDASASSIVFAYLMQDETDAAFLDRVALRAGCEWFVENDKLVVRPRPALTPAFTATYGPQGDIRRFRARYSGVGHIGEVEVRGWDPAAKAAIVGKNALHAATPPGGSETTGSKGWRGSAQKIDSSSKLITGGFLVESADEAAAIAKALGSRQLLDEFVVSGEMLCTPTLRAGKGLKIEEGVGTKLKGTYYLTEVEHHLTPSDEYTRFVAGARDTTELVDLLGSGSSTTRFSRSGLVVGLVTNNMDKDSNMARVKVKFPGFSGDNESAWARVVSVGAGKKRGLQVIPEVDDEVLVGFEQGDPRRPYVLGGLWNGKDPAPLPADGAGDALAASTKSGAPDQWLIRSVSGHRITLHDATSAADQVIELLNSDTKTKLVLSQSKVELISNQKPLEIKDGSNKASIVMDGKGKVTIKGEKIDIIATQGLKITAGTKLELKGFSGAAVDGGPNIELTSTGMGKLQVSGVLTVKGSMTMIN